MAGLLIVSSILLWVGLLITIFLLLGINRNVAILSWRMDKLEATTPTRVGRGGLKIGSRLPDFTLRDTRGVERSHGDILGRRTLLVFTQPDCGPCDMVVPSLNALAGAGSVAVVAVSNGDPERSRSWAMEKGIAFPVLCQENWSLSRRFEVLATPFAFVVDERGMIVSKGVINDGQQIRFLLSQARSKGKSSVEGPKDIASMDTVQEPTAARRITEEAEVDVGEERGIPAHQ